MDIETRMKEVSKASASQSALLAIHLEASSYEGYTLLCKNLQIPALMSDYAYTSAREDLVRKHLGKLLTMWGDKHGFTASYHPYTKTGGALPFLQFRREGDFYSHYVEGTTTSTLSYVDMMLQTLLQFSVLWNMVAVAG